MIILLTNVYAFKSSQGRNVIMGCDFFSRKINFNIITIILFKHEFTKKQANIFLLIYEPPGIF